MKYFFSLAIVLCICSCNSQDAGIVGTSAVTGGVVGGVIGDAIPASNTREGALIGVVLGTIVGIAANNDRKDTEEIARSLDREIAEVKAEIGKERKQVNSLRTKLRIAQNNYLDDQKILRTNNASISSKIRLRDNHLRQLEITRIQAEEIRRRALKLKRSVRQETQRELAGEFDKLLRDLDKFISEEHVTRANTRRVL